MKRLSILILLMAAAIMLTSAQTLLAQYDRYDYITYTRHEIFLQYGAPTFQELSTQIRRETSVAKDGKIYVPDRFVYTGVAALGYKYYTSPYMSFGGYLGISAAMMKMAGKDTGTVVFKSSVLSLNGPLGLFPDRVMGNIGTCGGRSYPLDRRSGNDFILVPGYFAGYGPVEVRLSPEPATRKVGQYFGHICRSWPGLQGSLQRRTFR
jgi:hypothetical protein